MEIKGQIEEIVYTNEENSYTVCTLSLEDDTMLTAVGYLPFLSIGDVVILYGKMVNHNMYGEQFKVDTFEKVMPVSTKEIEKYLGSGIIKGVGPVTSKKIINKFGDNAIYVLRFEPYKLAVTPIVAASEMMFQNLAIDHTLSDSAISAINWHSNLLAYS